MVKLDLGAKKDIGRAREKQEDEFGVWKEKEVAVLVVADGMGGLAFGEIASKIAVETILDFCKKRKVKSAQDLEKAIEVANKKIGEETNWAAGTTLCAGLIKDKKLWVLNVGDSRAYLIKGENIEQLTIDHRYFPFKHIVTRSLGNQPEVKVDIFERDLKKGDFILLCTDGLHDCVPEEKIMQITFSASEVQSAAEELISTANKTGGFDNMAVVVAKVLE